MILHRPAENSRMDFSFESQFRSAAFLSAFDNTEVDEDIYLENTYLLTSLTSASYVG